MQEMQDISNTLFSNNALGLAVAAIIFVITLLLLIRKIIGIALTLILLFFAIVSGLAIANNDVFRDYLKSKKTASNQTWEDKFTEFKDQLIKDFENFKSEHTNKSK